MSLLARQRAMRDEILATDEQAVSPAEGMEVYRNAYRNRLLEALRSSFEKTCKYVGGEAFDTAACHHIILDPPTSWTLDDYGAGFDLTLAELFAEDPEVAELAWLEWHMQRAFGSVDVDALDAAKLAAGELGIPDWDRASFTLVPSFAMRAIDTDCTRQKTIVAARPHAVIGGNGFKIFAGDVQDARVTDVKDVRLSSLQDDARERRNHGLFAIELALALAVQPAIDCV